jgi:hypothetical protein
MSADTVDNFISACLNYIKVKVKPDAAEAAEAADAVKTAAAAAAAAEATATEAKTTLFPTDADADVLIEKLPDILKIKKYTAADSSIYIKKGDNNEYHAINITTGNAWIVNAKNTTATDLKYGGKKSKTHRQKKVHRSTQKRNGRKKTSHRRK